MPQHCVLYSTNSYRWLSSAYTHIYITPHLRTHLHDNIIVLVESNASLLHVQEVLLRHAVQSVCHDPLARIVLSRITPHDPLYSSAIHFFPTFPLVLFDRDDVHKRMVPRHLLMLLEVQLHHRLQHHHAQAVLLAILRLEIRLEEGENEAVKVYREVSDETITLEVVKLDLRIYGAVELLEGPILQVEICGCKNV